MTIVSADPAPQFVKRARERLGLKQDEFGKLLGLSRHTVIRYEAGDPVPEYTKLAIKYLLADKRRKLRA